MSDPNRIDTAGRPPIQEDIDDEMQRYDDDGEEMDPLEEAMGECQLMPDGQCLLAGSEHCDFECPMRDSEHFAGSRAWLRKHDAK